MNIFRLHSERLVDGTLVDPRSGNGAAKYGGRWNNKLFPVVYCAESRSLSVLECVVHMAELPDNYCLTVFSIPEGVQIESVDAGLLPAGWNGDVTITTTKDIGTEWLTSRRTAVLRVPSVVVEDEFNYLLNPQHGDFSRITIRPPEKFRFDARLRPPPTPKETL
jgi:RES domain-containing protein